MPDRNPVLFLENNLRSMEDLAFLEALILESRGVKREGILSSYRKLRSFLMGREPDMSVTDFHNTKASAARNQANQDDIRSAREWCHASRKVYTITDELKDLILGMSFGDLEWSDLTLPHGSFILALESPIPISIGDDVFNGSSLLISVYQGEDIAVPELLVGCFSDAYHSYRPLGEVEKSKFRSWPRTHRRLLSALEEIRIRSAVLQSLHLAIDVAHFRDLKIVDSEERLRKSMGTENDYSSIYRLIAGFCFYLQTLPPGSPHRSAWTGVKNFGKPDPKAITNGAEICTVSSSVTLTSEERRAFGGEGRLTDRELSAHFRRGHFRRAPGTGNDPNAPKVVLVRPTLVRKDRLQPGELVGGSEITTKMS